MASAGSLLVSVIEATSEFINCDVVCFGPGLAKRLLDQRSLFALLLEARIELIIALLEGLLGGSISVAVSEADIVGIAAGGHVLAEGVEDGVHLSLKIGASTAVGDGHIVNLGLEGGSFRTDDVLGICLQGQSEEATEQQC